jgi:hypothetical protein
MNRFTRFTTALVALVLVTTPLAAQTQSSTASVSVQTLTALSLTKIADLNFGSKFAGFAYGSDGEPNGAAVWQGSVTSGSAISVAFSIPSSLSDGASHTVPFSCGTSSADVSGGGQTNQGFNPASGVSRYPATGGLNGSSFTVSVGNNGGGTPGDPTNPNGCTVDLTSALGNTAYSGTITTTVSVVP